MTTQRLPLLALFLALAGCDPAPREIVHAPDEHAVNNLYRSMEDALKAYEVGLTSLRAGELARGRFQVRRAVDSLAVAGDACAATAGCETQRFMSAYHNLLTLRSDVLIGALEGFVEVDGALDGEASPRPAPSGREGSIRLLNGQDLGAIIELNPLVRAALNDWLTWMRPTLIDAYENYRHLRHLMWPVYEDAGLPEALLFGILAKESGGRVHSVSRAGAAGPLQFMPHTGLRFGLRDDNGFDLRFDPTASTRANVAYLRERFLQLDDNLELALAAYNGGEGRIQRLVRGAADPRFWSPEIFGQLPRETQEYVPYVLAAAYLFLYPERHGIEFPRFDARPAALELEAPMTLAELAICLGQAGSRAGWFRTLRNLNPRHEHDVVLPEGTLVHLPAVLKEPYYEHCVEGDRLALARDLHAARDERRDFTATRIYTVRSGDTLSTIVEQQGCPSLRAVAQANSIEGPRYLIRPGQRLTLTGCRR